MAMFPSLIGTVESKKVSDKSTMPKLWFLIKIFTNGTFISHEWLAHLNPNGKTK